MVVEVGFEPTNPWGSRFTVCRFWPLTHSTIVVAIATNLHIWRYARFLTNFYSLFNYQISSLVKPDTNSNWRRVKDLNLSLLLCRQPPITFRFHSVNSPNRQSNWSRQRDLNPRNRSFADSRVRPLHHTCVILTLFGSTFVINSRWVKAPKTKKPSDLLSNGLPTFSLLYFVLHKLGRTKAVRVT